MAIETCERDSQRETVKTTEMEKGRLETNRVSENLKVHVEHASLTRAMIMVCSCIQVTSSARKILSQTAWGTSRTSRKFSYKEF